MSTSLPGLIASFPANRIALGDETERVTYGELLASAQRVSTWCGRRYGIDRCVVLKARPTVAFFKVWLGVVHSGNKVVPVDAELPEASLRYVLQKTCSSCAVEPEDVLSEAISERLATKSIPNPNDVAMIMFTSGTTGTPKGVVMTNANLLHSWEAVAEYLGLGRYPSTICALPLHYSYGLISQALCVLAIGGYVRLIDGMKNPLAFERIVRDEEIASFCGVPSSFSLLARFHRLKPLSMPSIRVICSAGAAFDMALYNTMTEIFPDAEIFNNYGMTEACPRISYVSDRDPMFHKGSCGVPMRGVELVTLDPESHVVLPDGAEGVLGVRGPNVMRGYLDDEERNQRIFQSDGYLVSGDVAQIVDGHLFLRGRLDDMFNVGGEKVAPLEIEMLLKQVPTVTAALVKGFCDPDRGQVPIAFLMLSGTIDKKALDAYLRARLISAKIPFAYYEVSELTMTSNGKLKRNDISPSSPFVVRRID